MKQKSMLEAVGSWTFILGVILALLVGILSAFMRVKPQAMGMIAAIMAVLGLIVGLLNINDREVNSFIIAAIGLSVGSVSLTSLGSIMTQTAATAALGQMIQSAFSVFGTFVAGAVVIPALKSVYKISKD